MKDNREIVKNTAPERAELERHYGFDLPTQPAGYGAYRELNTQEGMQFSDLWRAVRKRLWLVIGLTVLLTTLTAIYMARRPDVYQATATVQVDLEQTNPDLLTTQRRVSLSNPDPAYFNTQLQLLTSETLLRRAVKELNLDSNKEFQAAKSDESASAWRSFLRTIGLASDPKKKSEKTIGESLGGSSATSEEVAEAVRLAPYLDIIRRNLSVEPVRETRQTVKETRLINVSYRHSNPELAAMVVNGIAEVFTKQNQEKRSGTSKKTSDFLDERIADLQTQIKDDEVKLAGLKRSSGIINLDEQSTIVLQRLEGLNKQLLDSENLRKNAEAQFNSVKNSPDQLNSLAEAEVIRYTTERENDMRALRTRVMEQITQLRVEREKLLIEFQSSSQEVQEVDKKIETLNTGLKEAQEKNEKDLREFRTRASQTILDNLRTKFTQAKGQEDKVRSAFNEQYNEAQTQNGAAINIRLLEQNLEANKGFLKDLNQQQSSNIIVAQGSDNNVSIAEIAIPPETPIAPRRLMTVFAAFVLSTLFGAGLALFMEYLDDTIHSTEEVESALHLPALAAIPTIDSMPKRRLLLVGGSNDDADSRPSTELLITADSRSSLAEAYRQLRTSILLSTAGHAPKSLLVTSSLPSEGKTTTAINTSISLAQTGAKVLIIDADLRRPRLHSIFGISNAQGLSTILSSELQLSQILEIIAFDDDAKLHLLPSGPIPPNPAELVGSEQMSSLLKKMEGHFTHVVVDSPPIASFTDGVLIASMVDGVVLVVNSGKSSRQIVRRARQLLLDIGAKIFGVVLNNVNLRAQDSYYYQSYYHRTYYRHDDAE